jgi:hypothetical protein
VLLSSDNSQKRKSRKYRKTMDSIYVLGKKTYYITKIVKNADLGRNFYDSKASIVGKMCEDVCMKHDIPSRNIVL